MKPLAKAQDFATRVQNDPAKPHERVISGEVFVEPSKVPEVLSNARVTGLDANTAAGVVIVDHDGKFPLVVVPAVTDRETSGQSVGQRGQLGVDECFHDLSSLIVRQALATSRSQNAVRTGNWRKAMLRNIPER